MTLVRLDEILCENRNKGGKCPKVGFEMSKIVSQTLLPGVPSKRSTLGMASPTLMGAMVLAVEDIDLTRAEENSGRDADAARTLNEIIFLSQALRTK